jgi:hypothetical protein
MMAVTKPPPKAEQWAHDEAGNQHRYYAEPDRHGDAHRILAGVEQPPERTPPTGHPRSAQ